MTTMTKEERDEIRTSAELEIIRIGKLIPQSYTPENRTLMYKVVGMFILWVLLMVFFVPGLSAATDPFVDGKDEIVATVGSGSTMQFALLVIGLCAAGITGFITKNWGGAIGGFVVGMIFLNVALKVVGL